MALSRAGAGVHSLRSANVSVPGPTHARRYGAASSFVMNLLV